MKKLDVRPLKNLKKVTMNAKFPTSKSLPVWLKVNQIVFDPSKGEGYNSFSLEYASKLVIILDQEGSFPHDTMSGADFSKISKMRNLQTLQIEWSW